MNHRHDGYHRLRIQEDGDLAIALCFNFVVVRKKSIEQKHPGGLDAFRSDRIGWRGSAGAPDPENMSICSGFTPWGTTWPVLKKLEKTGMEVPDAQESPDMAIGDRARAVDNTQPAAHPFNLKCPGCGGHFQSSKW